jgi:hypothetical protein
LTDIVFVEAAGDPLRGLLDDVVVFAPSAESGVAAAAGPAPATSAAAANRMACASEHFGFLSN